MKNYILYLPLFLLSIACGAQTNEAEAGGDVNVAQAQEMINENADLKILDVRSLEEVANGYIKGSVNINFHDDDFQSKIEKLPKDKTYLVYCHAGGRSSKTMKLMNKLGFSAVYNLDGGITAWKDKGGELSTD